MTVHVKRLVALAVGVTTVVILGSSTLGAQGKEAQGTVTAVSSSSLTITSGAKPMTFVIDKATKLENKAAARKTRDAKATDTPGIQLTDYIKVGNPVLVRYEEANGANHAMYVRAVSSPGEGAAEPHDAAKIANGTVKAVTASQVTLASDGKDMTFAINRDTDVLARGATKTTKAAGGTTTIADFVHNGDDVSITYVDKGGTMTASQVRVRVAKK
jgi:hypothetical protein